jgi:Peptidase of plants and bacteria
LIHEAVHVVQDYQFELVPGSAIWCWAEGIADYCRLKLDPEFNNKETVSCNPEEGYKKAASFLDWLSLDYPSIVPDLNKLIRNMGLELKRHDDIFFKLLQTSFNDLKRKCINEKVANQG